MAENLYALRPGFQPPHSLLRHPKCNPNVPRLRPRHPSDLTQRNPATSSRGGYIGRDAALAANVGRPIACYVTF
jgi:hypothetical protein